MPLVNGLIEPTPFEAAYTARQRAYEHRHVSYMAWCAYIAAHKGLRALQDHH